MKKTNLKIISAICIASLVILFSTQCTKPVISARTVTSMNKDWKFQIGDVDNAYAVSLNDVEWRILNLPHDWSIEGKFSNDNPATPGGGALPGGIGWYRKHFLLPKSDSDKVVFIDFDGVYQNSEVWINDHYLGKRPYGYISFRYELTPWLHFGTQENVIAVRVDNSQQPNSRWYTGSGIYRNMWLTITDPVHVDHWGTFVTTPNVSDNAATVSIKTQVRNQTVESRNINVKTTLLDMGGKVIATLTNWVQIPADSSIEVTQQTMVSSPKLWSVERPTLYKAISQIIYNAKTVDDYTTSFGIRTFKFDSEKGFFLNGKSMKILGVCNHHDLGCLGAAINVRAIERQLEILKAMGCNSIRTSHNPPAPELLDLCDRMGFLVQDEAFDIWKKNKSPFDYAMHWDEWHKRDLTDFIRRDRNHPSIITWSIGNEILEQWDASGTEMTKELAAIVRDWDSTRPITSACNDPKPSNYIIKSGALDLIGYNYHHEDFLNFHKDFPGKKFISTETNSSLATRGSYDMPSDSVRIWPVQWDIPVAGNPDWTCSSYDNCRAGWGSSHEDTWRLIKHNDFLSGLYIWTGFDYLGEPTPYSWPARSSYFGLIDLAGFPKDAYYFYQSEWITEPMLHLFPHWNWNDGDVIDVWVYTNVDAVELFLNDKSLGTQQKTDNVYKLVWNALFTPGTLRAVGFKNGKQILEQKIQTAGAPAKIVMWADRNIISADGRDLSFVTVKVLDAAGNLVPHADNMISFDIKGNGFIAGVDNGLQTSHEPFQVNYRKAFNGLCLVVVQATEKAGNITLGAISDGLESARVVIKTE
ncbi:DUF4982 domain-containing protein [candidate division KSB1 bacterium]|nr:DUF4982 domain-containing protein [candidate division KSB1 bacterium]